MTLPIAGPMPQTEAWYALRFFDPERKGQEVIFGASEAAAAMGLSPYTQPLELYLRKRREMPDEEDNDAMEMGRLLEPVVLSLYERRTGIALERDLPMFFHSEHSFMGATPDARCVSENLAVDAKTSTYRRYDAFGLSGDDKFGEEGGDQLPTDYIIQAQAQMAVLGINRVDFPVLFDGRTLRTYTVHRESTLIDAIVSAEYELAQRIVEGRAPEPNWQHPDTRHCLQALYGLQEGTSADLDAEAAEHWLEAQRKKVQRDNLEAEIEAHKNRVLAALGGAELGNLPGGARQIKRTVIKTSLVTQADVDVLAAKIGAIKRRGHERLTERKRSF